MSIRPCPTTWWRVGDALNSVKKAINGSRVHLFGVAYKKDVGDVRESPALDILELLARRGAVVSYTDPYVPTLEFGGRAVSSLPFEAAVSSCCDCAIVSTDHGAFDYSQIAAMRLVVDTRDAIKVRAPNVFAI